MALGWFSKTAVPAGWFSDTAQPGGWFSELLVQGDASVVAPTITVQPTNQSASVGATATFTATIAGTTPMSWKWQILTP